MVGGIGGEGYDDWLGWDVDGNRGPKIIIIPTLGTTTRHRPPLHILHTTIIIPLLHTPHYPNIEVQQSIAIRIGTAQRDGSEGVVCEEAGGAEIGTGVGGGVGGGGISFDFPYLDFAEGAMLEGGDGALLAIFGGAAVRGNVHADIIPRRTNQKINSHLHRHLIITIPSIARSKHRPNLERPTIDIVLTTCSSGRAAIAGQ
mmetsp:Transcript_21309/g.38574  ORF Transcript_21309/g.38574 Transcript_21309/m.38574 type:complete len:201 (+) Transcript_21309:2164-2766(+)